MSGILTSLHTTCNALDAFRKVMDVVQNNVANASTTGYAKQIQQLAAMSSNRALGGSGGVSAVEVESTRDAYAEQAVRRETTLLGDAEQRAESLASVEYVFDISNSSGISKALNQMFQAFSAWGQNAGDSEARQTVVERAGDVARAFNQAASGLTVARDDAEGQIAEAVGVINALADRLASYNKRLMADAGSDAGIDAQIHASLEELSGYVDITATKQANGTYTVLIDGQVPLVMGARTYELEYALVQPTSPPATYAGTVPPAQISSSGANVTDHIETGRLGALLDVRNRVLPSYLGDAWNLGQLNEMAAGFAGRVNTILESGYISDGATPVDGIPLFTFDNSKPAAASTLAVNPAITADTLAAIDPGPPSVSNGIPLRLAALANPEDAADEIDGSSYIEYYGRMASRLGAELEAAEDEQTVRGTTVAQAKNLRQELSGVSLDEEAVILLEFQRAYEANSRVLTVLDDLTQQTIALMD